MPLSPPLRKADKPPRSLRDKLLMSGFFLAVAVVLAWLALTLLQTTWQSYLLDQRFANEGVQTQGYVSGFRYVEYHGKYAHRSTGQYPVVAIETPKGRFQIPTSYAHPLDKAQQDELLWKKVDVIYLRDEPSVGRVLKWHSSSAWVWVLTVLGMVLLLTALFIVYISFRLLVSRKTPKTLSKIDAGPRL
jgi:hypothetical protein